MLILISLALAQGEVQKPEFLHYQSRVFATGAACADEQARLIARFAELGRPVSESNCTPQAPAQGNGAYVQLVYQETEYRSLRYDSFDTSSNENCQANLGSVWNTLEAKQVRPVSIWCHRERMNLEYFELGSQYLKKPLVEFSAETLEECESSAATIALTLRSGQHELLSHVCQKWQRGPKGPFFYSLSLLIVGDIDQVVAGFRAGYHGSKESCQEAARATQVQLSLAHLTPIASSCTLSDDRFVQNHVYFDAYPNRLKAYVGLHYVNEADCLSQLPATVRRVTLGTNATVVSQACVLETKKWVSVVHYAESPTP